MLWILKFWFIGWLHKFSGFYSSAFSEFPPNGAILETEKRILHPPFSMNYMESIYGRGFYGLIDIVLSIIKMETNFGKWKPNFTPVFCAKRRSRHYRKNHPKYADFKTLSHAQLFSQGIYLGILFVFGRIIRQITPFYLGVFYVSII